ncbi:hypothetical protein [Mucilaginibacter sp.]|uniref:hypothetical protein n=1 Tax=Mucilaginibacter sp. TaxID=1882438 RepID=UPI00261CB120|nr:hypothetical protein [Mucilaginibacter sp.]MDB4924077.1 hypothetical protein [Mucilaginibacter sp.]
MKKATKFLLSLSMLFVLGITASNAQMYVSKIPPVPVRKRAPQPSPKYVWMAPEWDPYGHYYMAGFWGFPPQAGAIWIQGRWSKTPKGYTWIGGHWK